MGFGVKRGILCVEFSAWEPGLMGSKGGASWISWDEVHAPIRWSTASPVWTLSGSATSHFVSPPLIHTHHNTHALQHEGKDLPLTPRLNSEKPSPAYGLHTKYPMFETCHTHTYPIFLIHISFLSRLAVAVTRHKRIPTQSLVSLSCTSCIWDTAHQKCALAYPNGANNANFHFLLGSLSFLNLFIQYIGGCLARSYMRKLQIISS